ncbi:MAG: hypothetical protein JWO36_1749, partial [Myxococcales bacterium]|nr:hypothetical protein [Myxococcales bacterium]
FDVIDLYVHAVAVDVIDLYVHAVAVDVIDLYVHAVAVDVVDLRVHGLAVVVVDLRVPGLADLRLRCLAVVNASELELDRVACSKFERTSAGVGLGCHAGRSERSGLDLDVRGVQPSADLDRIDPTDDAKGCQRSRVLARLPGSEPRRHPRW